MGSTRLPGKVLKSVLNKPLLQYQIERVKSAQKIDEIIIATTTNEEDNLIINLCESLSVRTYRGSEENVFLRYYEAAKQFNGDVIVRLTSDCPLIDSRVIDEVVSVFLQNNDYDYVSNTIKRTFPRGMDTEVLSIDTLEKLNNKTLSQSECEHVTSYIMGHLNEFRVKNIMYKKNLSAERLTVDTIEDFNLIKRIIEHFYPHNPNYTLEDIIDLLDKFPEWRKINAHVEQKKM